MHHHTRIRWAWRPRRRPVLLALAVGALFLNSSPDGTMLRAEQGRAGVMMPPPDLTAASDPQRFSAETLFEIINGDADIYLKAGFVHLDIQRFHLKADPRQWLDLSTYLMEGHRSAFAVYSLRREPQATAVGLTPFADRYGQGFFFVHGPYYVEIVAAGQTAPLVAAGDALGAAFVAAHPVGAETIPELAWFPAEDLVAGSMALHPSGAFGFEGLRDLFTARYRLDGGEATAFFRPCRTAAQAMRLAADYQAFLEAYDGVAAPMTDPLPNGRLVRMGDGWTLVFTQGRTLVGVQEAATPVQANLLARRLKARLATSR